MHNKANDTYSLAHTSWKCQYVTTVGLNEATIKKYIQDQEKADIALDKLSLREYTRIRLPNKHL